MQAAHLVALGVAAVLLVAVVTDLRRREIPDLLPLALLALGVLASWRGWQPVTFAQLGLGFGTGLALGAALFSVGAMGGGDAKLCAGLGAACGLGQLGEVLFATALCGGVLALLARRRGATSLPYAPAFALGHALTLAIAWGCAPATGLWHRITGVAMPGAMSVATTPPCAPSEAR